MADRQSSLLAKGHAPVCWVETNSQVCAGLYIRKRLFMRRVQLTTTSGVRVLRWVPKWKFWMV